MLQKELLLEKYVINPIRLGVNEDGMLECGSNVIDDGVSDFDAVTDAVGNVHGISLKKDGSIIYFRISDGFPISKIIAKSISGNKVKHLSITEYDGILHILIVIADNGLILNHYRTHNGSWTRSAVKTLDTPSVFTDCCPGPKGSFFVLVGTDNGHSLLAEQQGKWQTLKCDKSFDFCKDISITYCNGAVEAVTDDGNGKIKAETITVIEEKYEDDRNGFKAAVKKEDDEMANGSIINSKFISELERNSEELQTLKSEMSKLEERFSEIKKMLEGTEKQYRFLASYKDALNKHEAEINQLVIKIQEMANRINGMAKKT